MMCIFYYVYTYNMFLNTFEKLKNQLDEMKYTINVVRIYTFRY